MAESALAAPALERRYRRLLFAYPAEYQQRRGDEIVATLLDLAPPGRRFPTLADAADLIGGGVRRRFGTASIAGFEAGLALAAPFALAIAAGISAYAWWRVEPIGQGAYQGGPTLFGLFRTLGPIVYLAWLLAAAARSVLRPAAGRLVIAAAIAITLVMPALEALTGVDRPPLWVLMALAVFGALALGGTSVAVGAANPSPDERLAIPAGAVAVAVTASAVVLVWPPVGGGFGYYYQPTIARVGTVVAATVATVAGIAIVRVLRREPAQSWLWATVLLGLPAGWLGPFDTAALRLAGDAEVPRFGRLAQVLLATCLACVAMRWLVARRPAKRPCERDDLRPSEPVARRPSTGSAEPVRDRERGPDGLTALARAGAATLGCLIGLAAFVAIGGLGLVGFVGVPLRHPVPGHVVATAIVLLATGALATLAVPAATPGWLGRGGVGWGALGGFVGAIGVAAYDNSWTGHGWDQFGHTTVLVATIAFLPLSACAVTAVGVRGGRRWARIGVVAVSLGWLGYATVPFILSWGPVLLVLLACCAVLALTGRRSATAP